MRAPDQDDIHVLAKALAASGVEYVLIGGAAMALHGFPRMTKDIDLLLPVDAANNRRLMEALKAVPDLQAAVRAIKKKWLDGGYSTAIEGNIHVDLLFVAADHAFGDLRRHIRTIEYDGVPIRTLDVEGMLITKNTTRESDRADRLKLQRLKSALAAKAKGKPPSRKR